MSLLKVQLQELKLYIFHFPYQGSRNKIEAYNIACVVSNDLSTRGTVKVKFCILVYKPPWSYSLFGGASMPYTIFLTGSAWRFAEVVQDNEMKFSLARAQDYGIMLHYRFR